MRTLTEDVRADAVVLAAGGFEANAEWRARYLEALALRECEPAAATRLFTALAAEVDDPIAARFAALA